MDKELVRLAVEARGRAIAPFSNFFVGAAILASDGSVFTGCNIENSTLGLTICAERVALLKALSEGKREFLKLVVVTDAKLISPPCGPCRQLLWEFCGDIEVRMVNLRGGVDSKRVTELLPWPFDMRNTKC